MVEERMSSSGCLRQWLATEKATKTCHQFPLMNGTFPPFARAGMAWCEMETESQGTHVYLEEWP